MVCVYAGGFCLSISDRVLGDEQVMRTPANQFVSVAAECLPQAIFDRSIPSLRTALQGNTVNRSSASLPRALYDNNVLRQSIVRLLASSRRLTFEPFLQPANSHPSTTRSNFTHPPPRYVQLCLSYVSRNASSDDSLRILSCSRRRSRSEVLVGDVLCRRAGGSTGMGGREGRILALILAGAGVEVVAVAGEGGVSAL